MLQVNEITRLQSTPNFRRAGSITRSARPVLASGELGACLFPAFDTWLSHGSPMGSPFGFVGHLSFKPAAALLPDLRPHSEAVAQLHPSRLGHSPQLIFGGT